jgi:hypothetical protein
MMRPVPHRLSTAELRARIGGHALSRKRFDLSSVAIVAAAMLTAPLVMWLISLLVKWTA